MNLTETNIPDVTKDTINRNKQFIAESIIQNIYPLFDEVLIAKKEKLTELKKAIGQRKATLKEQKRTIEEYMGRYNRAKKVSNILDRLDKLIQLGLAYDGAMKHETVILLKIIDKLSEDQLNQQLSKTMQIINKRFSK